MDFIKRFLGNSPDHTDRLLQVLLLIALVAMIAVLARWFFHHLRD
jgi:predicted metal-dependent hydrolase